MDDIIRLEPLVHRDMNCIALVGQLRTAAYKVVQAFPGRKYSKTHGCWYVEYEQSTLERLADQLGACQMVEVSDKFELRRRSDVKKSEVAVLPEGYHESLSRIRYSGATVKTYESQMRMFLNWLHPRTLGDLTDAIINDYQLYLTEVRKISTSTQNTAINAIKYYLEKVHHGERKVYYIDRPIKETKMPRVLSQEEVKALMEAIKNIKHRCIAIILYAAGLRMSELLNLRWKDFDEHRLQLFVNGGKGRKDRMTIISKSALAFIKYYMSLYKPKDFLFEGQGGGKYSPGSVNKIIDRAAKAAGILKDPTAHTLRHSFATHLLEQGTDIRYIQALMGHENSKTTERYTHVTTKGFSAIRSPLDGLNIDLSFPAPTDE